VPKVVERSRHEKKLGKTMLARAWLSHQWLMRLVVGRVKKVPLTHIDWKTGLGVALARNVASEEIANAAVRRRMSGRRGSGVAVCVTTH
jgi:hypothetical protein